MGTSYSEIAEAVGFLRERVPYCPEVAVGLGSGLGAFASSLTVDLSIPYGDIPHFAAATVDGHEGRLLIGRVGGRAVAVLQGRLHHYEGYSMAQVTFPIRVLGVLGVHTVLLSNAAGGLRDHQLLGDIMVIRDHISLQTDNPLRGPNLDELGPRFPDLLDPYDPALITLALRVAEERGFRARTGVYLSVPGPNFETRAEYAFFRVIGADAVSMSTVPEVLVARHMGLRVFAASVITDLCTERSLKSVSHEEVLRAARVAEPRVSALFTELIHRMPPPSMERRGHDAGGGNS